MAQAIFGGRALLLADDANAFPAEPAESADDRLVLAEFAVASERGEFGDQPFYVVDAMRPLRVTRDLGFLPGRQVGVEVLERLGGLGLEPRNLIADRNRAASLHGAQLLDLGFEFGNRLFEVEIAAHRGDDLGFLRPESRRSPRPGRRFTSAFFNGKNGGPRPPWRKLTPLGVASQANRSRTVIPRQAGANRARGS